MLNHITLMGRLTRDPELRYTQSQIAVASFSLAVERDFKAQNGEKATDFFDIVAWRNTAEFVNNYFSKGRMMIVAGRLQTRKWQDRDGNNRVAVEVVAESCYFGDSKKDNGGDAYSGGSYGGAPGGSQPSYPPARSQFTEIDEEDGNLPF